MITLTDKALLHLRQFYIDEGIDHRCVRIVVRGGGCSGLVRDMTMDDYTTDMDETFQQDDITIIVDCVSLGYLGETLIDYVESDFGGGFHFAGPENHKSCGCGESFNVQENHK